MTDLTALTDADLDTLRAGVLAETECRQRLTAIPAQVADLAARYITDGGDPADLTAALPT